MSPEGLVEIAGGAFEATRNPVLEGCWVGKKESETASGASDASVDQLTGHDRAWAVRQQ